MRDYAKVAPESPESSGFLALRLTEGVEKYADVEWTVVNRKTLAERQRLVPARGIATAENASAPPESS